MTHSHELIVDNFAGGGGASLGIELALGRSPDIAVNHDDEAVAMHAANHPATKHYCESVWDVDPVAACAGRPVGLAWFSPDCTHFSKAKGGKPRSNKSRGLAWVAVRWARKVRPRVIVLENVEEFQSWGPLLADGTPCPERKGLTFRKWAGQLRGLGYVVEYRELTACDYGAPTTRKRLFLVARCDGQPIIWPEPTHGPGRLPYRTAADCIDWSLACPSIFDRAKPLADATLARISRGIQRFVLSSMPFVAPQKYAATLIQTGYGERVGQAPRALDLSKPLGTVVAGGAKHAIVAAFLAKHYGGNYTGSGVSMRSPMATITTVDHHALVVANLIKLRGTCRDGQRVTEPMPTVTAGGTHIGDVVALLSRHGSDGDASAMINGVRHYIADVGMRMLSPRELARAQGFPDSYRLDFVTKTAQIRMIGNSVSPPLAAAIVAANYTRPPT